MTLTILTGHRIVEYAYHCFQIESDFYICPIEADDSFLEAGFLMNHSCSPNCGVRGQLTFVAMHDIKKGEEVTYDYAMTDMKTRREKSWDEMECACKSEVCRKVVTGDDWKIPELQRRYKGYFSDYLEKKIENSNKRRETNGLPFLIRANEKI